MELNYNVGQIAEIIGATVIGNPEIQINGLKPIGIAGKNDLTFLTSHLYSRQLQNCSASAVLMSAEGNCPDNMVRLISKEPYKDFRKLINLFYADKAKVFTLGASNGNFYQHTSAEVGENTLIEPNVCIAECVKIGKNCILEAGSYIGAGSQIGDNTRIGINVVVKQFVNIGNNCKIGDGSVIGYDGFGYSFENGEYESIPQVGTVVIEDDVHIGSNCCIDRATIGETRIGKGSKLDNLIQIAHGVVIAKNTVIAAQAGISGSTKIGSYVRIGGQAGIVGHIEIGDQVSIGAQAGVTKSFVNKETVSGYPARPHGQSFRIEVHLQKLPEYVKIINDLKDRVSKLEASKEKENEH